MSTVLWPLLHYGYFWRDLFWDEALLRQIKINYSEVLKQINAFEMLNTQIQRNIVQTYLLNVMFKKLMIFLWIYIKNIPLIFK